MAGVLAIYETLKGSYGNGTLQEMYFFGNSEPLDINLLRDISKCLKRNKSRTSYQPSSSSSPHTSLPSPSSEKEKEKDMKVRKLEEQVKQMKDKLKKRKNEMKQLKELNDLFRERIRTLESKDTSSPSKGGEKEKVNDCLSCHLLSRG